MMMTTTTIAPSCPNGGNFVVKEWTVVFVGMRLYLVLTGDDNTTTTEQELLVKRDATSSRLTA
jgi:hypothetical protein